MPFEILFLGTGTSAGIPMIGCDCPTCRSDDARDRRDRPSVLVRYPDASMPASADASAFNPKQIQHRQFIIDTAFEMRHQVIRAKISRIDGVLFTHSHADHIFGLDDLRRFNAVMKAPIDIHAEPHVLERLQTMFQYIFAPHHNINPSFVASLVPHPFVPGVPVDLYGATWTPIRLLHGKLPIAGFRVEHGGAALAYCTDVSSIPPESYPLLQDLDVLVIDALRYRHHPTHLTVDQALQQIEQIKPRRAYLTHLAHDIRHAELEPRLPDAVYLSYDGLELEVG